MRALIPLTGGKCCVLIRFGIDLENVRRHRVDLLAHNFPLTSHFFHFPFHSVRMLYVTNGNG